jgi:hypothetical protein
MFFKEQTDVATCRLIMLQPDRKLLAERLGDRLCLPRVLVWRRKRTALQLQIEVERVWHQKVIVLHVFDRAMCGTCFAILELLTSAADAGLIACPVSALQDGELTPAEAEVMARILDGGASTVDPFSRPGWIKDALLWLDQTTATQFGASVEIKQYNGAAGFALVRFTQPGGRMIWLKAVGDANVREFYLTRMLSRVCEEYLPQRLAEREDWKAWLMDDAGATPAPWTIPACLEAARVMASIQRRTLGSTDDLLAGGAFDWRLRVLRGSLDHLVGSAETWFDRQHQQDHNRLGSHRLGLLVQILRDASDRMESLSIPDAVIHGDINEGNILVSGARLVFTDWCEVGIGNPFLALPFLERVHSPADPGGVQLLRTCYKEVWLGLLSREQIERASVLAPLLTPLICLFGRRGWGNSTDSDDTHLDHFRCGMIRRIERVAEDPRVLGVLYS